MARVRVKVDLPRLTEEIGPAVQAKLLAGAEVGAKDAARRAPVDTGELRGSIHAEKIDGYGARYGSDVEHAIYQELGTYKMKAQPFLRPSMDSVKQFLRKR